MQDTFDNPAASKNGEVFTIHVYRPSRKVLLAYRNIKKNTGSKTCEINSQSGTLESL
ncbi:MAG: hypothetical protein BACD_03156 [Bacteroides rodentium]